MEIYSVNSVWEIIGETPEEVRELQNRAELFNEITDIIIANKWANKTISKMCSIDISRAKELKKGFFELFSLKDLQTISEALKRNLAEQKQQKVNLNFIPTLQPA